MDLEDKMFVYRRKYQLMIDKITPKFKERWATVAVLVLILLLRMLIKRGYAVIAYLFGLYFLQNTMLYLSPLEDPEEIDDDITAS